ncbi:hypothetical protein I316_04212 [Kwoniella heveanensis BCC8398]|uniref:Uncharacterized protein n=1 Tax=Kwoniella heveanensis BCC8398 TaxID=1296120 RepID=A0A1B9GT60_9TREE|nr:hypothetical protein I316_04212 [Kwoniella heveanensis BCC8398]
MPSPCTPTSSVFFPRSNRMSTFDLPTRSAVLAELLQKRGIGHNEVEGCLIEFILRSWTDGKRVREWCEEISQILELIPISTSLKEAIHSPPLQILLPFVHLPSNAFFPSTEPPLPSPLLPTTSLGSISRNQLIAALVRLSIENYHDGSRPFCDEPLVCELCLEYIAKRWRSTDVCEEGTVDMISKKLTEVEFELQVQGHPATMDSTILPIFHKIRFQLGFVTSPQLVTRLNNTPHLDQTITRTTYPISLCVTSGSIGSRSVSASASALSDSINLSNSGSGSVAQQHHHHHRQQQPNQIVRAWVQRRLCTGVGYQLILDELSNVKSRLNDDRHREILIAVLDDFGIRSKLDEATCDQFGLLWLSPSPTQTSPTGKRIRPLPLLTSRMRRKRSVNKHHHGHIHAPKWLSHRRNNSSSSKISLSIHHPEHCRPSLPSSSPVFSPSPSFLTSPSTVTFPDESVLRHSTMHERPRTSFHDDLTSSLMSLTDPEDVRTVLLNQLMEMRYHVHGHDDEGWFLGGGREQAEELMGHLEQRMLGKKDLMGLREVFNSMRSAFDLGPGEKVESFSRPTTYMSVGTGSKHDTMIGRHSRHGRSVSFDLENYLAELAPPAASHTPTSSDENEDGHCRFSIQGEEVQTPESPVINVISTPFSPRRRASAGATSVLTMASMLTTDSQIDIASRMSCFEIQQAKREFPLQLQAIQFHFPARDIAPREDEWETYKRVSRSVPNLQCSEKYTRLPPRVGSLRKSKMRSSQSLSRLHSVQKLELSPIPATPLEYQGQFECQKLDLPSSPGHDPSFTATSGSPSPPRSFHTRTMSTTATPVAPSRASHSPLPALASVSTLCSPSESHLVTPTPGRRASFGLGLADKSRRNLHRHFAIFDGEQVSLSPTQEMTSLHIEVEDPVTPRMKLLALNSDQCSDESHTTTSPCADSQRPPGVTLNSTSKCSSSFHESSNKVDSKPGISPRISSLKFLPKVSFVPSSVSLTSRVTKSSTSSNTTSVAPQGIGMTASQDAVPLGEVMNLLVKQRTAGTDSALSVWEVEEGLQRVIQREMATVVRGGGVWDEQSRGRLVWLIEQVAVLLGDPIYIAPISRVIASLSASTMSTSSPKPRGHDTSPRTKQVSSPPPPVPSKSLYRTPRYATSQPHFPSSMRSASSMSTPPPVSSSCSQNGCPSTTSTPHPLGPRPNILRRHTGTCLSISSLSSVSSKYSTPSMEMMDSPPPPAADSPSASSFSYNYNHSCTQASWTPAATGSMLGTEVTTAALMDPVEELERGYEDWETPLPERMDFPVPRIRMRNVSEGSVSTVGTVGTFGEIRRGSLSGLAQA